MPILQSAVNALGLADTTKDIAQAVNNLINANNAMDVGAAAGELAASLATGVAVHGLLRPAMGGVRLGLAVSGQP
jgi:hypothetical protein